MLYTLVTWIRKSNDGLLAPNNSWPYPFMETSTPVSPLWYMRTLPAGNPLPIENLLEDAH